VTVDDSQQEPTTEGSPPAGETSAPTDQQDQEVSVSTPEPTEERQQQQQEVEGEATPTQEPAPITERPVVQEESPVGEIEEEDDANEEEQLASSTALRPPYDETSDTGVLKSLRLYDDLRARDPTEFVRPDGTNVDLLELPDGEQVAFCHLSAIIPFTFGPPFVPWLTAFEDAASIAMAVEHLNSGNGVNVPEVEGLNERCNVRFTLEFADTEFSGGVTLGHVVDQVGREPGSVDRIPCAFLGAYRSAVSIPMSLVTGVFEYPQISGASTSAALEDKSQYPLFGRTIPTDAGNAIPIIIHLRSVFTIKHLAVINVNDAVSTNCWLSNSVSNFSFL
jgi:hypothetical protein